MARGDQAHGPLRTCARWQVLLSGARRQASMIWLLALQLTVGPAQHYEKAKQDFAQRKFPEAVSEVNTALHGSPAMVPARVRKAPLPTLPPRPHVPNHSLIPALPPHPPSQHTP